MYSVVLRRFMKLLHCGFVNYPRRMWFLPQRRWRVGLELCLSAIFGIVQNLDWTLDSGFWTLDSIYLQFFETISIMSDNSTQAENHTRFSNRLDNEESSDDSILNSDGPKDFHYIAKANIFPDKEFKSVLRAVRKEAK